LELSYIQPPVDVGEILILPKRWYVPDYTLHSSLYRKSRSLEQHFDWNKGNELKFRNLCLFVSAFVKQLKEFWQNLVLEPTVNCATLVFFWIFSVQHYLYFTRRVKQILCSFLCSWDRASRFYVNKCPTRCNDTQFILSANCCTCFEWFLRPSSGAQITVSTASGTSQPLLLPVTIHDSDR